MRDVEFSQAFKYVFNRPIGMLNILWIFLPIIGWLALIGYVIRIIQEYIRGKFRKLPYFRFSNNLVFGLIMFFKSLPLLIVFGIVSSIINKLPLGNITTILLSLLILPMLFVNLFHKESVRASFDLSVVKPVFSNLIDYVVVLIKTLVLQLIFMVMSIILVGIPALVFTKNIFIADFFRRHIK